jgi:hypothetical protein
MKVAAIVLPLLLFCFQALSQKSGSNEFSYIDNSGNQVSVDLSVLPVFLDSSFLKESISFGRDSNSTRHLKYAISDLGCARDFKNSTRLRTTVWNPHKRKYVLFMRVFGTVEEKPEMLDDAISSSGYMYYYITIRRVSKSKFQLEQMEFTAFEI